MAATRGSRNSKLYYIVLMAVKTGMRFSEIISLKYADINMGERYILINQTNTKNKKQRFIPINNALYAALEEYLKLFPPVRNSTLFGVKSVRGAYENALKKAVIYEFRFHTLFQKEFPPSPKKALHEDELFAAMSAGGYPEVLSRNSAKRRNAWFILLLEALFLVWFLPA